MESLYVLYVPPLGLPGMRNGLFVNLLKATDRNFKPSRLGDPAFRELIVGPFSLLWTFRARNIIESSR